MTDLQDEHERGHRFRRALDLMHYAHAPQTRLSWDQAAGRYVEAPYAVHPSAVAELVHSWVPAEAEHSGDLLTAAILHDVAEDQPARAVDWLHSVLGMRMPVLDGIGAAFGARVERVVRGLTNPPGRISYVEYRAHVERAIADPLVFVVKFADYHDNALALSADHPRYERLRAKYAPLDAAYTERLHRDDLSEIVAPAPLARLRAESLARAT